MSTGQGTISTAALDALRHERIDHRHKGFSPASHGMTVGEFVAQRRHLFDAAFLPPILVVKESSLAHNITTMARFCEASSVLLAPHAKTAVAPQLLARQLAADAWGVSVATPNQLATCLAFGISPILLANELVDTHAIEWLTHELDSEPELEVACYVDSAAGVSLLEDVRRRLSPVRPLSVLVELGHPNGRAGCRGTSEALDVARAVHRARTLQLVGVAGYEGGLGQDRLPASIHRVRAFLSELAHAAEMMRMESLFAGGERPIVAAGGSLFFPEAAEILGSGAGSNGFRALLRPGAYVSHDSGLYERHSPFGASATGPRRLRAAISVWAHVLSRPEPELAIASLGRRDVSFDSGLPVPLSLRRPGEWLRRASGVTVTALNDQHAFVSIPAGADLRAGDWLQVGISHPCTTFDKWRLVPLVDDEDVVVDLIHVFA